MSKFLISGATGFVGSCITRYLIKNGESVSVISRDKELNWRLKDIKQHIEVYEADLLDDSLQNIIKKIRPEYVFHFAAYGSLPIENEINKIFDINIKGTINFLKAVNNIGVKLFINTGSSSEYEISGKKIKESDSTFPINDYGISKLASTLYCTKEARLGNLPIITFRLFSPYGYFEAPTRLVPNVIINALNNQDIHLSSPTNVRDFIFIEDVISVYMKAIKVIHKPGEIYNIGSGIQHSVEDVITEVMQKTESRSNILWTSIKNQARQVEPSKWEADISKAVQMLSWKPKFNLSEGITKTIEWFKVNKNLYE